MNEFRWFLVGKLVGKYTKNMDGMGNFPHKTEKKKTKSEWFQVSTQPNLKKNICKNLKNGFSSSSSSPQGLVFNHQPLQAAELSGGTRQNHLGAGHSDAIALGRQDLRRTAGREDGSDPHRFGVWSLVKGKGNKKLAYVISIYVIPKWSVSWVLVLV